MSNFGVYCISKNKKPMCDEANILPGTGQNLNQTLLVGNFTGGEDILFNNSALVSLATLGTGSGNSGVLLVGSDDSTIVGGSNISIAAGASTDGVLAGGQVNIFGGATAGGGAGGNVTLLGGSASNAGSAGNVTLQGGNSAGGAAGDVNLLSGSGIGGGTDGNIFINSDTGTITITSNSPTSAITLDVGDVNSTLDFQLGSAIVADIKSTAALGSFRLRGATKMEVEVATGMLAADGRIGTITLMGATGTVFTQNLEAADRIFLGYGDNQSNPGAVFVSARINGTPGSFTISSTNNMDGSDICWWIIRQDG